MMKFAELKMKMLGISYRAILKNILFLFDAERVHNWFIMIGKKLGGSKVMKGIIKRMFDYENKKMLEQEILGIKFRNPVGLATGFDKNAEITSIMEDVGFGFADVGSVSAQPCKGNRGKRMWRIRKGKALLVNLGLNNKGAAHIASKLHGRKFKIPFGVSTALTNSGEERSEKEMIEDYIFTLKKFREIGDYFIINISCPSAHGGMPFCEPGLYEKLMKEIDKIGIIKPIFIKMNPDMPKKDIDKIISISGRHEVDGFICSNLTKQHDFGKGGMSGKFLEEKANELLAYMYKKTKRKFVLIGAGGIFSAEDAYKKIKLGANLIQVITGMIYEGPQLIGEINYGLAKLLERYRYKNVKEAIGAGI